MQPLRPLRTPADYEHALIELEALWEAAPDTPERDRRDVLSVLVADYERRAPLHDATGPVEALRLDMELHRRTQADLARVLGSRSRASEILSEARALAPAMADRVAKAWSIPRGLLGPPTLKKRARGASAAAGVFVGIFVLAFGANGGIYVWETRALPPIEPLVTEAASTPATSLDAIPLHVRQAFLSAEDSEFYRHDGASLRGVARAMVDTMVNLARRRNPSGGSTITEQLIKNTLLEGESRSLGRRMRQLALSAQVEAALSKDQILALYLNRLYFGDQTIGLGAASRRYFGVDPQDLSMSQGALLAAMAAAPNAVRIDRAENAQRARSRRNWVLMRMAEDGFLRLDAVEQAMAMPIQS